MKLDEQDLKWGMEFIVGTWKVDFVVNYWSNDLAHIPAEEFKADDGHDYSQLSFEFFEDHRLVMKDPASGQQIESTWKQTSSCRYHFSLNGFFETTNLKRAETMEIIDGKLTFSLDNFAIGLKKVAEGTITKAPDIGDIEPTADDLKMKDIVGRYSIVKAMSFVGEKFGMFTRKEVAAYCHISKAAGKMDDKEVWETLDCTFDTIIEFTDDHKVKTYMPLPTYVSQKEIDQAVANGEITLVDGMMESGDGYEWNAVNGAYYYDSHEDAEVFGEKVSPWKKLEPDKDGLLELGPFLIKKMSD